MAKSATESSNKALRSQKKSWENVDPFHRAKAADVIADLDRDGGGASKAQEYEAGFNHFVSPVSFPKEDQKPSQLESEPF